MSSVFEAIKPTVNVTRWAADIENSISLTYENMLKAFDQLEQKKRQERKKRLEDFERWHWELLMNDVHQTVAKIEKKMAKLERARELRKKRNTFFFQP